MGSIFWTWPGLQVLFLLWLNSDPAFILSGGGGQDVGGALPLSVADVDEPFQFLLVVAQIWMMLFSALLRGRLTPQPLRAGFSVSQPFVQVCVCQLELPASPTYAAGSGNDAEKRWTGWRREARVSRETGRRWRRPRPPPAPPPPRGAPG